MPRNTTDPLVKRRDIDAFEAALSTHPNRIYWDIWVIARSTACRIGDVLDMTFHDINQHNRWTFKMQKQKRTSKDGKPLPQRVSR
ncbi:MAG: hypothetical protein AAF993_18840 [Pseudomonadota bacterium]